MGALNSSPSGVPIIVKSLPALAPRESVEMGTSSEGIFPLLAARTHVMMSARGFVEPKKDLVDAYTKPMIF